MKRTYSVARLNQRSRSNFKGHNMRCRSGGGKRFTPGSAGPDYINGGGGGLQQPRSIAPYTTYCGKMRIGPIISFGMLKGVSNNTYVRIDLNKPLRGVGWELRRPFGLWGFIKVIPMHVRYMVRCGERQGQSDIALDTIPAFQFAIFIMASWNSPQCAPLTVRGRTHANGPICVRGRRRGIRSSQGLVTTTASIVTSNLGGYSGFATPVYSGTPSPAAKSANRP